MQTILRIASPSDAEAIADLVNRAYLPSAKARGGTHESELISGERTSVQQVSALFCPRSCILLLCQETRIVACVHLRDAGDCVHIGMLATDPALQTQGLGKQRLMHAEQYATEHFNASCFKMSVVSARPELLAFYERRGYLRTGEIADYPVSAGVGRPKAPDLELILLVKSPPALTPVSMTV